MEQVFRRIDFPVYENQKATVLVGLEAVLDAFPDCDRIAAVKALAELEMDFDETVAAIESFAASRLAALTAESSARIQELEARLAEAGTKTDARFIDLALGVMEIEANYQMDYYEGDNFYCPMCYESTPDPRNDNNPDVSRVTMMTKIKHKPNCTYAIAQALCSSTDAPPNEVTS
jgi:hypothetical protein